MNREELTKTFMMILNKKKPLVSMVYTKNMSALQGLRVRPALGLGRQLIDTVVLSLIFINTRSLFIYRRNNGF